MTRSQPTMVRKLRLDISSRDEFNGIDDELPYATTAPESSSTAVNLQLADRQQVMVPSGCG